MVISQARGRSGSGIIQVLLAVGLGGLAVYMCLPSLTHCGPTAETVKCRMNLRNVGVAFRTWATDHEGQYPYGYTNATRVFTNAGGVFRNYLVLTNELGTSKIPHCPMDKERKPAAGWAKFDDTNLSYYVGLVTNSLEAEMLLSGDRNLTLDGIAVAPGMLTVSSNSNIGFAEKMHRTQVNAVMGDGSVRQLSASRLRETLKRGRAQRLLIP